VAVKTKIKSMSAQNLTDLRKHISGGERTLWIGALSFEERCLGSICTFQDHSLRITSGILLKYLTDVYPKGEADSRLAKHHQIFERLETDIFEEGLRVLPIEPYSFQELQDAVRSAVAEVNPDLIIFDITCLTKLHTLALSSLLPDLNSFIRQVIAYSTPENYSAALTKPKTKVRLGWKDIIVAPLANTALLFNESFSRGIVILGNEADRLVVGLAELEPSGGLIVKTYNPHRPDLHRISENHNKKIVRQLTRMRASNWTMQVVDISDLAMLRKSIEDEVNSAQRNTAPVILFPYGPKLLVFCTALQLSCEYPESSWFVYPVPSAYPVHYTEGVDKTLWLMPDGGLEQTTHSQTRIGYLLRSESSTGLSRLDYLDRSTSTNIP
jgi:hypothetical protein